jgi:2-amino-4-hydroxy-6-hydroxymethyldihydropteridine diphosphokinase
MSLCYLGLGSNLDHPERQLRTAVMDLRHLPRSMILEASSIYKSKPLGIKAQPSYRNMVVSLKTTLNATSLLELCKVIEMKHQRIIKQRWGSRTLDIDILFIDNIVVDLPHLKIPHPELHRRDFVLIPLKEISQNDIAINGINLSYHLRQCQHYLCT